MLLHNAMDDGKAKSCPFSKLLRPEEGVEYLVHDLGRYANARTADNKFQMGVGLNPVRVAI